MVVDPAEEESLEDGRPHVLPCDLHGSLAPVGKVSDLGRYRLIAELARGGMGVVYLALVRGPGGFNKLFVVKELKAHLAEDPNLVRMFVEEARLAAKLNHPNVVQTMEVGTEGNRPFIAMEYLDGQSLNRALSRTRKATQPFPFHYALYVLAHMLEGLHYAHSASDFDGSRMSLVHRDVSPHNVFVTYDGQVKILDFGIAKALDSSNDTRTGMLKGKVSYMAPEQASGQSIDRRADVFSAGVMLFEVATGDRFWSHAQNDLQILHALANGFVARPRTVKPDIDCEVERIILKATAVKREERYPSAAEMQSDIEAYLKHLPVPHFGARDVGKFFADMFASDRARIKDVIDNQLRTLRGTISGEFGKIDLPRLTHSTAPSGTPSGVLLVRPEIGYVATEAASPASQSPTIYEGTYRAALGAAATTAPVAMEGERKGRGLGALFVVAGLAAVAAVAFFVLRRPVASPPAAPAELVAASVPITPSASAFPPKVAEPAHVVVTASPVEATVAIDGQPAANGTFRGEFPRDGRTHTIRIEAPRYEPKSLVFAADEDRTFDFSLELASAPAVLPPHAMPPIAQAAPAARPGRDALAAPPPTQPAAVTPAPLRRRRRLKRRRRNQRHTCASRSTRETLTRSESREVGLKLSIGRAHELEDQVAYLGPRARERPPRLRAARLHRDPRRRVHAGRA